MLHPVLITYIIPLAHKLASNFRPSPSHMFIKMLEDQRKLLRNYTQNIDTLENIAGIKSVVQCHGISASILAIFEIYTIHQ